MSKEIDQFKDSPLKTVQGQIIGWSIGNGAYVPFSNGIGSTTIYCPECGGYKPMGKGPLPHETDCPNIGH